MAAHQWETVPLRNQSADIWVSIKYYLGDFYARSQSDPKVSVKHSHLKTNFCHSVDAHFSKKVFGPIMSSSHALSQVLSPLQPPREEMLWLEVGPRLPSSFCIYCRSIRSRLCPPPQPTNQKKNLSSLLPPFSRKVMHLLPFFFLRKTCGFSLFAVRESVVRRILGSRHYMFHKLNNDDVPRKKVKYFSAFSFLWLV